MRMIEAGRSPLHISRVFNLVNTFQEANESIEFQMAMKYLGAIQFLEGGKEKGKSWKPLLSKLEEIDHDFEKLFGVIKDFLDKADRETDDDPDDATIDELAKFLSTQNYGSGDTKKFNDDLIADVLDMPSLTLEVTLDLFATMKKHPPHHIGDTASEWEARNKNNFAELRGVYGQSKFIVSKENLEQFPHKYIGSHKFDSLKYIFLDGCEGDQVKRDFISLLRDIWQHYPDQNPLTADVEKKISIKCIDPKKYEDILNELLKRKKIPYYAFWVFTTNRGNQIGFLGVSENDLNSVVNLTLRESSSKAELFNHIWEQIQ